MTFYENISKKLVAESNVDQKMILDYIIARWCNLLEKGTREEGVGNYDSGCYNFWGGRAIVSLHYTKKIERRGSDSTSSI